MGFFKDTAQTKASSEQIRTDAKVAKRNLAKHRGNLTQEQQAFYKAQIDKAKKLGLL